MLLHAKEGEHRQRVLDRLSREGIDDARVRFVGHQSLADYFRTYQQIDIALDPFPYVGGTTTCDALWMGVPVVTLAGKMAVHRGGVSILHALGLEELVAASNEDYIRIALELAADLPRVAQLRSGLRERMRSSKLMDANRFAKDVEDAYRRMWRQWAENRA